MACKRLLRSNASRAVCTGGLGPICLRAPTLGSGKASKWKCLTWRTQEKTDFISALCSLAPVCLWNTKFLASPVWPCTDPSLSRGSAVWYHWCSELGTTSCLGYRRLCFRSAQVCGVSAARRPQAVQSAKVHRLGCVHNWWQAGTQTQVPESLLFNKNAGTVRARQI